ncbi:MAG: hypothetical protein LQ350_007822 [Teloschistes chrysophthalmus]|nr:MAG: hypothetical protein LQ350_007822 [Niorma chrysophthalma]
MERPSGHLRELLDGSVLESDLIHIRVTFKELMEQVHSSFQGRDVQGSDPLHYSADTQQHIHDFDRCPVLGHARQRSVRVCIEPQSHQCGERARSEQGGHCSVGVGAAAKADEMGNGEVAVMGDG